MKNWSKILLPLTITLAAILFAQKIYNSKNSQPILPSYNQRVLNIKAASIDRITLTDKNGQLILNKNPEGWWLNNKKADAARVQELLSIILGPTDIDYELISQNLDRSAEFGLATTSATIKKLTFSKQNQPLLTVRIGNESYPGTFVQIENEANVYLTRQSLGSLISSDPQNFYEKSKPTK